MSKSDELHQAIINLPLRHDFDDDDPAYNYAVGHRDARHAAAEIAAEYVAELERELREIAGASEAQDQRERTAGDIGGVPYHLHGCDWPDAAAEEIVFLRKQLTEARQRAEQAELTCQSKQDAIDTLMAEVKAASERAEKAEAACAAMLQLCEWVDNTIGWRDTYYEAEGTVPPIIDIETDWCNPRVKLEMIPDSAKEILRRMEQAEAEVGRLRELLDESPVSGEALTAMGFNRNEEYGFWFKAGTGVEWDEDLGVVLSARLCQENVNTVGRFRMLCKALEATDG